MQLWFSDLEVYQHGNRLYRVSSPLRNAHRYLETINIYISIWLRRRRGQLPCGGSEQSRLTARQIQDGGLSVNNIMVERLGDLKDLLEIYTIRHRRHSLKWRDTLMSVNKWTDTASSQLHLLIIYD